MTDIQKRNDHPSTPPIEERNGSLFNSTTRVPSSDSALARTAASKQTSTYSAEYHRHVPDMSPDDVAKLRCNKPECSYAVLIGLAMRAAQATNHGQRLPVIEIYRFIE